MVVTDRWQRFSDLVVNEATLAMLSASADEFLVHGVDVEGKRLISTNILISWFRTNECTLEFGM